MAHLDEQSGFYSTTLLRKRTYTQKRPYKQDEITAPCRIYLHIYFNSEKYVEDEAALDRKLLTLIQDLENGKRHPQYETFYKQYFTIKETPVRGVKVSVNEDAVKATKRYYGFFTLVSNEKMTADMALAFYRNKDLIEKSFGNIKERLNLRRLLVSPEKSLEGKLFVAFVALIYLSHIKQQMQKGSLFKDYTLQSLLDKLDLIECFEYPGYALQVGEVLSKQRKIYETLGVEPPA